LIVHVPRHRKGGGAAFSLRIDRGLPDGPQGPEYVIGMCVVSQLAHLLVNLNTVVVNI